MKIYINDKEYNIKENDLTILKAVEKYANIKIPTLCYNSRLGHKNSCFVCVVEVEINGRRMNVPSCSTKISEGIKIYTNTPKVKDARKEALSLLVSNHFADCIAPCREACPANVNIQSYLKLVKEGKYIEADEVIREDNPLPIVCGRVCVRKCEYNCNRQHLDISVNINDLKRKAAENAYKYRKANKLPNKNFKVAIIGQGPAGLTAGYYLAKDGYKVDIYDKLPEPGGMLRYAIPDYRLNDELLDRELEIFKALGINFINNVEFGKDITYSSLKKQGYDSVILAIGAMGSRKLGLEGEYEVSNIYKGLEFLINFKLGKIKEDEISGKKVLVIGGGDVAIDAARVSLRLNAKEVKILYRRSRKEMPAHPWEIYHAQEEGVIFEFNWAPKELLKKEDKAEGIRFVKTKIEEDPNSKKGKLIELDEYKIEEADIIIAAIGQRVDTDVYKKGIDDNRIVLNKYGYPETYDEWGVSTSIEDLFVAGDGITGPSVVIDAIGHGKKAYKKVKNYLEKKEIEYEFYSKRYLFFDSEEEKNKILKDISYIIPEESIFRYNRIKPKENPPGERIKDFREIELEITQEEASREADRCFECGCSALHTCKLREYSSEYRIKLSYKGDFKYHKIENITPNIEVNRNKCIVCGQCIDVCSSTHKVGVLSFVERGFDMYLDFDKNFCDNCGNCTDVCPTAGIIQKPNSHRILPIKYKSKILRCDLCDDNCKVEVFYYNSYVSHIKAIDNNFICSKGRFEFLNKLKNMDISKIEEKDFIKREFNIDDLKNILSQVGRIIIYADNLEKNRSLYYNIVFELKHNLKEVYVNKNIESQLKVIENIILYDPENEEDLKQLEALQSKTSSVLIIKKDLKDRVPFEINENKTIYFFE